MDEVVAADGLQTPPQFATDAGLAGTLRRWMLKDLGPELDHVRSAVLLWRRRRRQPGGGLTNRFR